MTAITADSTNIALREAPSKRISISVLIPAKNEQANITRCLEPLQDWADEIVIVDSGSDDGTVAAAAAAGVQVVQFDYKGGWPKKRQWALDTLPWKNNWILLLDADEILTASLKSEIESAITDDTYSGYWLQLRTYFLGRMLRYGDTGLWKLSLFRINRGRFEKRLEAQDDSMCDMEVHEHVVVNGRTKRLANPIRHENMNSLSRYIDKHNSYSNWEAHVLFNSCEHMSPRSEMKASLFGNQAQRRRWLKKTLLPLPGSPFLRFFYVYIIRRGFLDGRAGLIYAIFKCVQMFHVKSKLYELRLEHVCTKKTLSTDAR